MSCFQKLVKATEDTDLSNIAFIILGIDRIGYLAGNHRSATPETGGLSSLGTGTTNQRRALLPS